MALYALTIFLSAFLLFQVQPVLGRYILPWFGGSPAVWTACMLFFQVALLAGYSYAHGVVSRLTPRRQGTLHLALLLGSLALLPITPDAAWREGVGDNPTGRILLLLLRSVGMPYLMLSATGPLLQGWFARRFPGRSPYRLYALSNAGSLLGLVTYPFLVEPHLRLAEQTWVWSACYGVFVVLCGAVAWGVRGVAANEQPAAEQATSGDEARLNPLDVLCWLGLAACGSLMLLATTNQVCQDVAVVPFLWVLPLSLYLLTFIICFDREQWYVRPLFLVLLVVAAVVDWQLLTQGVSVSIWGQILGFNLAMFVICMACHGEMVRLKPSARHLTLFYLMVSAGGAASGLFVALAAPRLFTGFYELHLALFMTLVLVALVYSRDLTARWTALAATPSRQAWAFGQQVVFVIVAPGLGWLLFKDVRSDKVGTLDRCRNFYGVLRTLRYEDDNGTGLGTRRSLCHGRINHGYQFEDPDKREWRTSYFGPASGIGRAFRFFPRESRRIGVVGLGAGALAAYAEPGDTLRYYEINPQVQQQAERWFTYLQDAKARGAKVDIVLGDGRITMEQQAARGEGQRFDILVADAFSGDAVPVHLMTRECMDLYWRHLQPDGILAVNITNRYINLQPVVRALAEAMGKQALHFLNDPDKAHGVLNSEWVLVTSNRTFIDDPEVKSGLTAWDDDRRLVWTDDFSNLYRVLRRRG